MVLFLMTKLVISTVFHKISCTFINRQAPHERMAYRCSFCGIIFDSISHRERHEQRHKVSSCKSACCVCFWCPRSMVSLLLQDNDTFECEDCHKMFKNEKNLRHHYKTHHELPHPKKTTAPGKPEPSAADKVQNIFSLGQTYVIPCSGI